MPLYCAQGWDWFTQAQRPVHHARAFCLCPEKRIALCRQPMLVSGDTADVQTYAHIWVFTGVQGWVGECTLSAFGAVHLSLCICQAWMYRCVMITSGTAELVCTFSAAHIPFSKEATCKACVFPWLMHSSGIWRERVYCACAAFSKVKHCAVMLRRGFQSSAVSWKLLWTREGKQYGSISGRSVGC